MEPKRPQLQGDDDSVNLARIRELIGKQRYGEALAEIATLGARLAESREALYLTAIAQRSQKLGSAALVTLERLQLKHPHFSRLYEERGHCLVAMNDMPRAIEAFERSVSLNAALLSSWSRLEGLYRNAGDSRKAAAAAEQIATLRRLPADIVEAGSLFCDGDLDGAERVVHKYLSKAGRDAEALRLLGRIEHRRNALDRAERLLKEAVELAPTYRAARVDYARVLIDRLKYPQSREELAGLLKLDPDNKDARALEATALAGIGQHAEAIEIFRGVLASGQSWPQVHLLLGNSLKAVGRQPEAIEAYRAAAAVPATYSDGCWSLANLKTYRFAAEEIERMRAIEASPAASLSDRIPLCFSLGKAFEDRGEYETSWRYYERGNALKHAQSGYDPQLVELQTQKQIEVCSPEFFAARSGSGVADPAPIFVVGLPRSGSTLIEQILASHSKVEGTLELHDIESLVRTIGDYPAGLAGVTADELRKLGERYLSDTRAYRKGNAFFIDKMPNNFRHVGLIHLILPRARIVDVRREPMACCFSNLKQLFARGQEFTYSIESIARYYRSYLRLMRHWDVVLPGRVLHVTYEDIVEDVEANVRRLLQSCELPFEPECLEYYKTSRSVSTASSEQVRQPIFRGGLSQWRHYEPWLGPLKESLGDALVRYREPPSTPR